MTKAPGGADSSGLPTNRSLRCRSPTRPLYWHGRRPSGKRTMNPLNLVTRVINILLQPRSEGPGIAEERSDPAMLYLRYVAILAALPAVASFVSTAFVGSLAGGGRRAGGAPPAGVGG